MNYIGDFAEDEKIFTMFNTFTSDDPSASCTITNFINTDVHIHKDDGVAQRNNVAGITVNTNFDGITGSHMIEIDTNDNTVAGFWVAGHDYFVRIQGATVDGATVNMVVCHFSIENRFMRGTDSAATAAALTTVDNEIATIDSNVDAILVDTSATLPTAAENATAVWDAVIGDSSRWSVDIESAGHILSWLVDVERDTSNIITDTGTTIPATITTIDNEIATIDGIVDNILTDTGTTLPARFTGIEGATFATGTDSLEALRNRGDAEWITATGFNTTTPDAAGTAAGLHATTDGLITTVDGIVDTILIDTNDLQTNQGAWLTAVGFNTTTPPTVVEIQTQLESAGSKILAIEGDTNELQTDWVNGGRLDNLLDGASAPTVGQIRTEMEGAGTKLSEILTDTGTTLPARFDGVEGATFATGTDSLEAIRNQGDSAWITGGGGAAPTATENAIAVWDRILTGATHNIATSAGRRLRQAADVAILRDEETAQGGSVSTLILNAAASSENSFYNTSVITITGGTGIGQARTIDTYVGSTKVATVCEDWIIAPDATSTYLIRGHACSAVFKVGPNALAEINTEVDTALEDINMHKHDQNMKAIAFSEY